MDEYIERKDVEKWLLTEMASLDGEEDRKYVVERLRSEIPAADVRPVVLCRDCVHFQQFRPHDGFCKIDGMLWNNDFFCANGKREES